MEELQKLKTYKGSGTSIVTLTVPFKTQVSDVVNHLQQEIGAASNIKDKCNRKSVIDALKISISFFRGWKIIPTNGLAVYAGWYV
jgi:peptide chain release factor subunit 1